MKLITTLIISSLLVISNVVSAQPAGTLDVTFNGNGKVVYNRDNMDIYLDAQVQADGKIVAVGTSYSPAYSSTIEVTRYLPDGTFDPEFGTDGHFNYSPNYETGAYKCLIREDGKILIAGYTTDYTDWFMVIIQLDINGVPDPAFGNGGFVLLDPGPGECLLYDIAVQEDGKIIAAGYAQNNDFRNAPVVVRLTASGILDTSFGTGGFATVPVTETDNDFSAVSIQSDGKILAAGHISNGLSWFSLLIARYDQDGNPDAGYGTSGVVNLNLNNVDDEFFDLELTENDEAILTGFTVSQPELNYHLLLMKFDVNGQPVSAFGNNGSVISGDVPYTFGDALVLQTDGKIIISGCTGEKMPLNNDWALWRFNVDGSPDTDFGTNGMTTTEFFGNADEALGVALSEDKIIVAGKTRNESNSLDFAVARYTNDIGVAVDETQIRQSASVSPNPVRRNETIKLSYELEQMETVTFELMNMQGVSVMDQQIGRQKAGEHSILVTVPSKVTAGIYLVRISSGSYSFVSQQLIVIE